MLYVQTQVQNMSVQCYSRYSPKFQGILYLADKELTDSEETLDLSQRDVEKLSSLVDEFVVPGENGHLDAEEHLYFGNISMTNSIPKQLILKSRSCNIFLKCASSCIAGNLVYSFGRRCYHALRFEYCVKFMRYCCKHITQYCQLTGQVRLIPAVL